MSIDPKAFRNALGCFATGVTVVTTLDTRQEPAGLTANSFSSLSLDPPLVLFCLDRNGVSIGAFDEDSNFSVNVLRDDQEDLARRFAQTGVAKWTGVNYQTWDTGVPILIGCIANLECQVRSIFEGGDHIIVVGDVLHIDYDGDSGSGLTYFRGGYGSIGP